MCFSYLAIYFVSRTALNLISFLLTMFILPFYCCNLHLKIETYKNPRQYCTVYYFTAAMFEGLFCTNINNQKEKQEDSPSDGLDLWQGPK